ncbi:hypothetical protein PC119_g19712, partial [Phytophthora cactorum]
MADSSDLPPYPGHGKITHAQRDGAELARIRIRQNERQLRSRPGPLCPRLLPLPPPSPALSLSSFTRPPPVSPLW